jgi:hypothetical protein
MSIKMMVQASYHPQNFIEEEDSLKFGPQLAKTAKKSRVENISTSRYQGSKSAPSETSSKAVFKVADFKNQELLLDVWTESPNIVYHDEHKDEMKVNDPNGFEQKFSLKLMAVSGDKSKLIGLINYFFHPCLTTQNVQNVKCFERLSRKVYKFQKSIDPNASVCFSTDLFPVHIAMQQDYQSQYLLNPHQKVQLEKPRYSMADDMGEDTPKSQSHSQSGFQDPQESRHEMLSSKDIEEESKDAKSSDSKGTKSTTNNKSSVHSKKKGMKEIWSLTDPMKSKGLHSKSATKINPFSPNG